MTNMGSGLQGRKEFDEDKDMDYLPPLKQNMLLLKAVFKISDA